MTPEEKTELKLGIGKIPEILLDNTDRNRTSPFAFTGNRFEFRAVGSSANCAAPMIVLNSALAYQLKEFKKEVDSLIERKNLKKDEAIFKVLRKYITKSKNILFEGDNYSDEWKKEAEKRGLSNIINVPESLSKYLTPQAKKVLIDNGIFDERELKGRVEVEYEKFTKKIQIEARVLGDLAINHIVPTAVQYQNKLIENVKGLKDLFTEEEFKEQANHRMEIIKNISKHVSIIKSKVTEMINARKVANKIKDVVEKAYAYDTTVRPFLDEIRYHADKLELIIDDELWPLPKYREILFTR